MAMTQDVSLQEVGEQEDAAATASAVGEAGDASRRLLPTGVKRVASTGAEELVRTLSGTGDGSSEDMHQLCCCLCSGNVMVLLLTTFLFALITVVQYYFGGVVTHSEALLADCNCMFVDALSYFLNIFAEIAPPHWKRRLQLTVPILSLSVLTGLTIWSAMDAIDTIKNKDAQPDPDEVPVSPWIVWFFGFFGLLFDCISIYAFCRNKKSKEEGGGQLPVNMLAAFMHVGADFIRSATTTVEGIFLIAEFPPGIDGDQVDAWSCIVITVVIVIAIMYGLVEVVRDIIKYCRTGE